jgi:hypothetical protein
MENPPLEKSEVEINRNPEGRKSGGRVTKNK